MYAAIAPTQRACMGDMGGDYSGMSGLQGSPFYSQEEGGMGMDFEIGQGPSDKKRRAEEALLGEGIRRETCQRTGPRWLHVCSSFSMNRQWGCRQRSSSSRLGSWGWCSSNSRGSDGDAAVVQ